jgi:hypothetical protein
MRIKKKIKTMNYIKLFEEFNYEQYKSENIEIVSRVILTLNNGKSNDYIIEVEGVLGKHKPAESRGDNNSILYHFKPTEYPKVFSTPDFQKLENYKDLHIKRNSITTDLTQIFYSNVLTNNFFLLW